MSTFISKIDRDRALPFKYKEDDLLAINKRDARTIAVNEEVYKWTVSPDSGYVVFVAESGVVRGSRGNPRVTSNP